MFALEKKIIKGCFVQDIGNFEVIYSVHKFFWDKNKTQNLVKGISNLKKLSYFEGLGSYFEKIQRLRKLSALISDELLISKEKVEIASSICKVDLTSDLVNEFPELQGIMGGHFAKSQGFDNDICLAIREHYLPTGPDTKTPKKLYSVTLAISDKLDTLAGFFAINLKPTSSKDPFALRRSAIGLIRLIVENKLEIKLKDIINYSFVLFNEQNVNFDIKIAQQDLYNFISDRLKFYMKEKNIRPDIIDCSMNSYNTDQIYKIFNKAFILNKLIDKTVGLGSGENCEKTLEVLADAKVEVSNFFEHVVVNDDDEILKKNRLELLQLLCKTFNNYINFSSIENT